jgi:phosphoglycerate dehydrogenase-like enzyme
VSAIDLATATARSIAVANMPGINSHAVAGLTLGLMLAVLRRIPLLDARTRSRAGWSIKAETFDHVGEIHGHVVGFIGFGQIPGRLAPVIEALGDLVVYANRSLVPELRYRALSFEELLAESDIVSLHLPLNPETAGIIDGPAISRMRGGAVLVSTARGELIDEDALCEALRSGHIAGAAVHVLATEPARATHPLFTLPNVVVTPHIAWLTPETLRRSLEMAIQNRRNLQERRPLLNRVA